MKRNPRLMMAVALIGITVTLGVPELSMAQRVAQRLPDPGPGDTIGDPGVPDGNGKNYFVPPGGYALIPSPAGFFLVSFEQIRWLGGRHHLVIGVSNRFARLSHD
jgi:hypothetical protein